MNKSPIQRLLNRPDDESIDYVASMNVRLWSEWRTERKERLLESLRSLGWQVRPQRLRNQKARGFRKASVLE